MINIQNTNDNECFKWCVVTYLHPSDHYPRRSRKIDKLYGFKLNFKNKKLPVKVRDIRNIERKNFFDISVFGYEDKRKYIIYVSKKCCEKKHVLLLITLCFYQRFKTLKYDYILHRKRKHFCRCCLQA